MDACAAAPVHLDPEPGSSSVSGSSQPASSSLPHLSARLSHYGLIDLPAADGLAPGHQAVCVCVVRHSGSELIDKNKVGKSLTVT